MQYGALVAGVVASLSLGGCGGAARAVVDRPSDITLKAALTSTVDAIYAARAQSAALKAANGNVPLGLNVCTVSAVFNIAATGTDTRSVTGSVSTPPDLYVSATVSGTSSSTATAIRGNQVTVTFTSPACNPVDTLGTKSPGDVVLLEREIEAAREGAPDPIHRGRPTPTPTLLPGQRRKPPATVAQVQSPPATSPVSPTTPTPTPVAPPTAASAPATSATSAAPTKPTKPTQLPDDCSSLNRPATTNGSTLQEGPIRC